MIPIALSFCYLEIAVIVFLEIAVIVFLVCFRRLTLGCGDRERTYYLLNR